MRMAGVEELMAYLHGVGGEAASEVAALDKEKKDFQCIAIPPAPVLPQVGPQALWAAPYIPHGQTDTTRVRWCV